MPKIRDFLPKFYLKCTTRVWLYPQSTSISLPTSPKATYSRLSSNSHWVSWMSSTRFLSMCLALPCGAKSEDILPCWRREIAEALIPRLDWRADDRVRTTQKSRGGVLTDDTGYGMTRKAVSRSLYSCARPREDQRSF